MYMCTMCVSGACEGQEESESLEPELQTAASGSLQEQQVLLAAESIL